MCSVSSRKRRSAKLTVKKKLPPEMKLRRYLVMDAVHQPTKTMGFAALNPSYDYVKGNFTPRRNDSHTARCAVKHPAQYSADCMAS